MVVGVESIKQSWSIDDQDSSDMIPNDLIFANITSQVYMLWFTVGRNISVGATNFANAFNRDASIPMYGEATLQLHFQAIQRFRAKHKMLSKDEISCVGDPIRVYIECVTGDNPACKRLVTIDEADAAGRMFMNSVDEATIEYRVWIVCLEKESVLDYGTVILDIVRENEAAHLAKIAGAIKRSSEPVDPQKFAGKVGSDVDYGHTLGDTEKYMLIRSMEAYCEAVDCMVGYKTLSHDSIRSTVQDVRTKPINNPAHPRHVFSTRLYFDAVPTRYVNVKQRKKKFYYSNGLWRFPKPDHVVRLNHANQLFHRLRTKMMPDYQALLDDSFQRQHMVKRRKKNNIVREIARGGMHDGDDVNGENSILDDFRACLEDGADENEDPQFGEEDADLNGDDLVGFNAECQEDYMTEPLKGDHGYVVYEPTYLDQEDYQDCNSLSARRLLSASDNPTRSSFHRLLFTGASMRNRMNELDTCAVLNRQELREVYIKIQRMQLMCYEDTCTHSTSRISPNGCLINEWYENEVSDDRAWLGEYRPIVYKNLTTFGNNMARYIDRMEVAKYFSTVHSIGLLFLLGSRDAYRHQIGCLHFNGVIFGPNSTSKSFILKFLRESLIDGTVIEGMEESKNANTVDVDLNDVINTAEEMKPEYMSDNVRRGGNLEKEARFKETITSNVVSKRLYAEIIDGRRGQRSTYSQQIRVYFTATNLTADDMSNAVGSRFHKETVHARERKGRSIRDMVGLEHRTTAVTIDRNSRLTRQIRAGQFLSFHIEKAIAIGALTDVTLTVFDICATKFCYHLYDHYMIEVSARDLIRMRIITRILVIETAMQYLYSSPISPHYRKPFSVHHFAHLDALLHDTEELVYFVFSWMRRQFTSCNATIVLQKIREHYLDNQLLRIDGVADMSAQKSLYLHPNHILQFSTPQEASAIGVMSPNLTQRRNNDNNNNNNQEQSQDVDFNALASEYPQRRNHQQHANGDSGRVHVASQSDFARRNMYAYLCIPLQMAGLSTELEALLKDSVHKLDKKNIAIALKKLCGASIRGHKYAWNDETRCPQRTSAPLETVKAVWKTEREVFVHLDLLQANIDPIDEAICATYHKLHKTPHTYLDAVEVDGNNPHIFRVRKLKRNTGKKQVYTDLTKVITKQALLAFETEEDSRVACEISERTNDGCIHIVKDYDQMSREDRCKSLYLPLCEANERTGCTSWKRYDRLAHKRNCKTKQFAYKSENAVTYPDDLLKDAAHQPAQQHSRLVEFEKYAYNEKT